jgi:Fe-S-cluster containining protein
MPNRRIKTECDRCGTCCLKGGPALHHEDMKLLRNGLIKPGHLITVRQGEPVFSLNARHSEPARSELVKIKGTGREWTCLFYMATETSCAIYRDRPLECSLLKCWDTMDLENVAGRNLISRYDILAPQDPLLPFIKTHDEICSLAHLGPLLAAVKKKKSHHQAMIDLTELVQRDLEIRTRAYGTFHFSLDLELFYFGRPLFTILSQFGIDAHEERGIVHLFPSWITGHLTQCKR